MPLISVIWPTRQNGDGNLDKVYSFKLTYDRGALPRCKLEGKKGCWKQV